MEIAAVLEQVAAQLGTTAEYLWSVTLRQAPINAAIYGVYVLVVSSLSYVWWRVTRSVGAKISDRDMADENWIWIGIGWLIVTISIVAVFCELGPAITSLVNPEYWALEQILDAVKPESN